MLPLAGKPLICKSAHAVNHRKYIDSIFVSTDDEKIAEVVDEYGINIPKYGLKGSFQMRQKTIFYNLQSYTYLMDNSVSIDIVHKLDLNFLSLF